MTRFKVNDKVKFLDPQSGQRVTIVGIIRKIDEHSMRATVFEHYAASIWGESDLQRGLLHHVDLDILEEVTKK